MQVERPAADAQVCIPKESEMIYKKKESGPNLGLRGFLYEKVDCMPATDKGE